MLAILLLWNQKETDTGSLLFAGMARSYIKTFSYCRSTIRASRVSAGTSTCWR